MSREIVTVPVNAPGLVEDRSGPGLVGADIPVGEPPGGHNGIGAPLAGHTAGDQLVEDGAVLVRGHVVSGHRVPGHIVFGQMASGHRFRGGVGGPDHLGQLRAGEDHLSGDVTHDDGVRRSMEDGLEKEPALLGGALGHMALGHVDEIGHEPTELTARSRFRGVDRFGFAPVLGRGVTAEAEQDLETFPVAPGPSDQRVAQLTSRVGVEVFDDDAGLGDGDLGRDAEEPFDVGARVRKAPRLDVIAQRHHRAGGEDVLELPAGAVALLGSLAELRRGVEEPGRETADLVMSAGHLDRDLAALDGLGGPLETTQSRDDAGGEQLRHHHASRQGQRHRRDGDGRQKDARSVDGRLLADDERRLLARERGNVGTEFVRLGLDGTQQGENRRRRCR